MDLVIKGLVAEFQQEQELGALPDSDAFEAFAAYCVLGSYYESQFNPDSFRTGGGNDLGVDAFGVLVNGELLNDPGDVRAAVDAARQLTVQIVVVQAKTSPSFETRVVSDLAENLYEVFNATALRYPASDEVANLRECLAIVYDNVPKMSGDLPHLHVHYVTTGDQVADMVAEKARSAERRLLEPGRLEAVEVRCVTRRELRALYRRATTKVTAKLPMPKKVFLSRIDGVEQALTGLMSAGDLVGHVLTDDSGGVRKTLFHDNVRDFLGYDRNEVNAEIRATLRDPVRRQRFAALNNGITIVTRELRVVGDDVHVGDFQIVNGCQTCHVLFDQRDQLTDAVQVSVRIVHSQDEDLINGIVSATNRQTAITKENLSAREDFHRELEDYFAHAPDRRHRLYYERRDRQYSDRKDVEKTRVISRGQLTRAYLAMFLDEPDKVTRHRTLLESAKVFAPGQHPVLYYAAAASHYRLEWLIRNRRVPKEFGPARYHVLHAIKGRLLGAGPAPASAKAAAKAGERILTVMWDQNESERLVLDCWGR